MSRQSDARDSRALVTWKAGMNGADWLDELVADGKALDLGGNGYPSRYAVTAGVLLAILRSGLPRCDGPLVFGDDYVLPSGWMSTPSIDEKRMLALDPSEILVIEAWDQS